MTGFLPVRRDRPPKPEGGRGGRAGVDGDGEVDVLVVFHSFRSAPAQKAREVPPVRIAHRRVGSASYHLKRVSRSACLCVVHGSGISKERYMDHTDLESKLSERAS